MRQKVKNGATALEAVLILSRFARASTDEPKVGPWARAVVELPPETGGGLQAIAAARSPEA